MKVALAQINPTVGDIAGNVDKILSFYRRACDSGAGLVLFPELALTGYPPLDLLEQPDFVRANLSALATLARSSTKAGLLVGFVDVNPSREGKPLYNAAALLHLGKVRARRYKTLLPTYDVFDEARYFQPAPSNAPVSFRGRRLGISICEDAWTAPEFWKGRKPYASDPVAGQVAAGAQLLANISSSPYERGKLSLRLKVLAARARKARRALLYCNSVGANDELIFDGNSLAFDGRGRLLHRAKAFEEDLAFLDADAPGQEGTWSLTEDPEELAQALMLGLKDYARKCGFTDVLVGLSGGIDSAVVCALAAEALGPERVTGVSMPSMYSSPGSVTDAEALARNLGIRFSSLPITPIYQAMMSALRGPFAGTDTGLAEQNLQARIRGALLMALSNKRGALLLATGNKSELSVGYCTLYGDMCGALAPIGDVPKTSVYELARWFNRRGERIPQASIDKPPSAELKPGQLDQDDLPPYDVLDDILGAYIESGSGPELIARRHPRALVDDVLRRIDSSEHKRRQAPPVLKITPKAFGIGRRMPIARKNHRSARDPRRG